jgi:Phosphotransferase enzyme family
VPGLAHEAKVVQLVAARRADLVPTPIAVDVERGWMLQRDAGDRLRELLPAEDDQRVWLEILPLYAGLQQDLEGDRDALLTAGALDHRLAALPGRFAGLLGDDEALGSLTAAERRQLAALMPRIEADCSRLAELGFPETIQHDDLHDGQVFVRGGRYTILDWGDACVSHPFFTLVVTLAVLAHRLGVDGSAAEVRRFRDAYLDSWRDVAPRGELERAYPLSHRLGVLARGLTWAHIVASIPRPLHELQADAVPERMRMLLEVYEAG